MPDSKTRPNNGSTDMINHPPEKTILPDPTDVEIGTAELIMSGLTEGPLSIPDDPFIQNEPTGDGAPDMSSDLEEPGDSGPLSSGSADSFLEQTTREYVHITRARLVPGHDRYSTKKSGYPRSQKAEGIVRLGLEALVLTPQHDLSSSIGPIGKSVRSVVRSRINKNDQCFLRPCPLDPNHGGSVHGLESCAAGSIEGVREALNHLRTCGQWRTELVVMPFYDALMSSVSQQVDGGPTDYVTTFGPGNDGVTAGTSKTVTLPTTKIVDSPKKAEVTKAWPLSTLQFEHVYDESGMHFGCECVQARKAPQASVQSAPSEEALRGYVPEDGYVVDDVCYVGDLEDMEREIDAARSTDKGVLLLQEAGSMMSHCAAHARDADEFAFACGIAKFQLPSQPPLTLSERGGWVVEGESPPDAEGWSPDAYEDAFREGIEDGQAMWSPIDIGLSSWMHQLQSTPLGDPDRTAYLAGRFVAFLMYGGLAALVGELRHFDNYCDTPNHRTVAETTAALIGVTAAGAGVSTVERSALYKRIFGQQFTPSDVEMLAGLASIPFDEPWEDGYGGSSWADCAYQVQTLADWTGDFLSGEASAQDVLKRANSCETVSHNNARLHTKLGSNTYLDVGAGGGRIIGLNADKCRKAAAYALQALEQREHGINEPPKWPSPSRSRIVGAEGIDHFGHTAEDISYIMFGNGVHFNNYRSKVRDYADTYYRSPNNVLWEELQKTPANAIPITDILTTDKTHELL